MTPYVHRLVGKTCILICCLLLTFQYVSAQAPAAVYLVSSDSDSTICAGESITFIATPSVAPAGVTYTYNFYRVVGTNSTKVNDNGNSDIIQGNRYTTTNTASNFRVKVEIVASPGAPPNNKKESGILLIKTRTIPTPVIKVKNNNGWSNLPNDVFSNSPEIILDARNVPDPDNDAQGVALTGTGFFTGEAVKRTGPNEYKFFPSFANAGINNIFFNYTQDDDPSTLPDEGCTITVQATITIKANSGAIKGLSPSVDINCVKNLNTPVGLNFENLNFPFTCDAFDCYSYSITYTLNSITGNGIAGNPITGYTFNPQRARNAGDITSTEVNIEYTVVYNYDYLFRPDESFTLGPITAKEIVNLYTIDELKITNSGQEFGPTSSFCRTETVILTGIPSSIAGQFRIKKPARPDGTALPIETRGTPYEIPWKNDATNYPAGEYEITYKYTNPNGCESVDKVIKFTLKEVPPAPSIETLVYNYCVGEPIPPLISIAGSGFTTLWKKGDPNAKAIPGDTYDPEVNNSFANSVNIYVTQFNGTCESPVVNLTIRVSPQPEANFAYKNVCQGDTTEFKDATITNGNTILNKKWNFGDGDILPEGSGPIPPGTHGDRTTGTYDNPKHTYQNTGTYQVTLSLVTSACPDSIIKPVYIFPVQSSFPYIETFETDAGGWLAKSDTLTSWKLKQPTGSTIIPDPSSPNAWITSNDAGTYNSPENSFVESPCFILENTLKPYVSVNIRSDIEEGLDGAVLQYVIDDGSKFDNELQWKVLGNSNQGINWYNASGIVSNPGGQTIALPIGWSGAIQDNTDNARWITAKFNLAQVRQEAGTNPVRFRIAFSSNTDNPPNRSFDGFAFDNFIIGEINRIVLLEHFTNSSQPGNIEETQKIYQALQDNDIAAIQYHTSFPALDSINDINKSDPSARALLYGIAKTNSTVLDGLPPNNGNEHKPFSEDGWGNDRYSQRILFEAPFNIDIQLTTESEEGPLQIQATISKNNTLEDFDHPIIVQTAIVEKSVVSQAATFQNVLRKLLPDAAGKRLSGQWKASAETRTEVISNSWQPKSVDAVPNTFAVIVFLQDENTKEIYQAKEQLITIPVKADPSGGRNGITTGEPEEFNEKSIGISPNPASSKVNISFGKATASELILLVYDALGKSVYTKIISKGAKEHILSTENYSPGIYVIHLTTPGNLKIFRKKVVIVR